MQFNHSFEVAAPVDEVWPILLDFERIAPCVPGAQLTEVEGNEYRGSVKIRLGPITAQYKGTATLVEVDETARRMVVVAKARDTHGQGNVGATLVGRVEPAAAGSHVFIDTDLQITGKVAQLGRGVMQDVSSRLLEQFVAALNRDVLPGGAGTSASAGASAEPVAETGLPASPATAASVSSVDPPEPSPPLPQSAGGAEAAPPAPGEAAPVAARQIASAEAEPIDLLAVGRAAVAKKLSVAAGVTVALAALAYVATRALG